MIWGGDWVILGCCGGCKSLFFQGVGHRKSKLEYYILDYYRGIHEHYVHSTQRFSRF